MQLKSVGNLTDQHGNWRTEQPVAMPFFDNRKYFIELIDENFEEKDFEKADQALFNFLNFSEQLKNAAAQQAYDHWLEMNDACGILDGIEVFADSNVEWQKQRYEECLWLQKLDHPGKVWEYLTPRTIVLARDRLLRDTDMYIWIEFDCPWEEEHGLHIILKNGNELSDKQFDDLI